MKSFVAAALVAVFLIGGAIADVIFVKNTTKTLWDGVEKVEDAIEAGDFDEAKKSAKEFEDTLDGKKALLCAIVDHKEINEIKRSLAELNVFMDDFDKPECLARCGEIHAIVERISDNTMPYVSNIL